MKTPVLRTFYRLVLIALFMMEAGTTAYTQIVSIRPTEIIYPETHDISPPLADMILLKPKNGKNREEMEIPNQNFALIHYNQNGPSVSNTGPDPALQDQAGFLPPNSTIVNVDGIGNISGYYPPDPTGEIGLNHYIQAINVSFSIYSRTGELLYGPAGLGTLWQGFPGSYTSDGDPIILYDHLADRWLISQFSLPNYPSGPYYELLAVSQTPDPLGPWYRYAYQFTSMPDYPKLGVWPDGYYMSINSYSAGALGWMGPAAVVLERDSILAGRTARMTFFQMHPYDKPMLVADLDGQDPPVGAPGYFISTKDDPTNENDHLELYFLHADWVNPANSALTGPQDIITASFNGDICNGSRNCIPQAGTFRKLDALSNYPMNRLQYRNFNSYQVLMANHTVDVDSTDHAGIRWYELRTSDGEWFVYQQGTYAPDTNHRWLGSIAMDGEGNIALAYSVSGPGIYPSIRATGRRAGDPVGQMTYMEESIMEGSGAQTNSDSRWGDYSCLTVDPTDDHTFWYTNEYYTTTSQQDWKTRIASFTINNLHIDINESKKSEAEQDFKLKSYPNPFKDIVTVSWQMKYESHVVIKIFDFMGKEIKTIVDGTFSKGEHRNTFDASALSSGVYAIRLNSDKQCAIRKITSVR